MKVIGIPGSNRKESFNKRFLEWIGLLLKQYGVDLEVAGIDLIPISLGMPAGQVPKPVKDLKSKVANCDCVIFATPQYNYSFPRILKNTIDWLAYPSTNNVWSGKRGYVVGVSMDTTGVIKAEEDLSKYMTGLGMQMFDGEPIAINRAGGMFDAEGNLLDKDVQTKASQTLENLTKWLKDGNKSK